MKKQIVLVLLAMLLALPAFAQEVFKLKAHAVAIRETDSKGAWKEWGDWQDVNMLVVLKSNKVEVYGGKNIQEYDIYGEVTTEYDKECIDDEVLFVKAVDQDGDRCTLKFRYLKKDSAVQVYVMFGNIQWVYSLVR